MAREADKEWFYNSSSGTNLRRSIQDSMDFSLFILLTEDKIGRKKKSKINNANRPWNLEVVFIFLFQKQEAKQRRVRQKEQITNKNTICLSILLGFGIFIFFLFL